MERLSTPLFEEDMKCKTVTIILKSCPTLKILYFIVVLTMMAKGISQYGHLSLAVKSMGSAIAIVSDK